MPREGHSGYERRGTPPKKIRDILAQAAVLGGVEAQPGAPPTSDSPQEAADLQQAAIRNLRAQERWLSEVNLQRLPFAIMWDKQTGGKGPIQVSQTFLREGSTVERRWQVLPGQLGIPGPTAYETFRALEKVLLGRTVGRGIPLSNPQEFEIQDICRELGLSPVDRTYRRIKQDLRRIRDCTFIDGGMLREKRNRQQKLKARKSKRGRPKPKIVQEELRFSLIDSLLFRYDQDVDGQIARSNRIRFGDVYLLSVNAGYVKPLDWDLWRKLERPVARRLYELIDLKIFSIPAADALGFDYDELAQLIPVTRKQYLSNASQNLKAPLEMLKGPVISNYRWHENGNVWTLIVEPSPEYRKAVKERIHPTIDVRAHEVARALRDTQNLPFYQRVVQSIDRLYVDIALSETKTAVHAGAISKPGAYFTKTLVDILRRRGLEIPFSVKKA